jgi:hypothetical protein
MVRNAYGQLIISRTHVPFDPELLAMAYEALNLIVLITNRIDVIFFCYAKKNHLKMKKCKKIPILILIFD